MTQQEFIKRLQEELEVEEIELQLDTDLNDLDEWDSMAGMVIIALVDELFGVTLKANNIQSLDTVQSLIDLIGTDKFN